MIWSARFIVAVTALVFVFAVGILAKSLGGISVG